MESCPLYRAYRFRLEPTPDQEERLRQFAGADEARIPRL